jgi:hypothetical protein
MLFPMLLTRATFVAALGCAVACGGDDVDDPPAGALHIDFENTGNANASLAPFDIVEGQPLDCADTNHGPLGASGEPAIVISGTSRAQFVELYLHKLNGEVPEGPVTSASVYYADESTMPAKQWAWSIACVGGCSSPPSGTFVVDEIDGARIDFHFDSLLMEPGGPSASRADGEGTFEMSGIGWGRRSR